MSGASSSRTPPLPLVLAGVLLIFGGMYLVPTRQPPNMGSAPAPRFVPVGRTAEPEEIPAWYRDWPEAEGDFPSLPLPAGVGFGSARGEYVNRRDGSVLVWVPAGRFRMGSQEMKEWEPLHPRSASGSLAPRRTEGQGDATQQVPDLPGWPRARALLALKLVLRLATVGLRAPVGPDRSTPAPGDRKPPREPRLATRLSSFRRGWRPPGPGPAW